jgi:hypothetical protein
MEKHVFFAVFMDHKKNIDFLGSSCIPPSKTRITLAVFDEPPRKEWISHGYPSTSTRQKARLVPGACPVQAGLY